MYKIRGLRFPIMNLQQNQQCLSVVLLVAVLWGNPARAAEVSWRNNVDEAVSESARENKPMLVMISAGWCGYCHKMLRQTFPNPTVAAHVNGQFVPLLIDADRESALVQKLKVQAMPTVLIVAPDRKILERISGFQTAAQLDAKLKAFKVSEQKRALAKDSPAASPPARAAQKTSNRVRPAAPQPVPKSAK